MPPPEESAIGFTPPLPASPEVPTEKPNEKEAFALLRDYMQGTLAPEEKERFENRVVREGGLDAFMPFADVLGAYYHASLRSLENLTMHLEYRIQGKKLDPIWLQIALAIRLLEPGERSLLRICEATRRTLRYQVPRFTVRPERWQEDSALAVIQEMDTNLQRFEEGKIGESLITLYQHHYAGKPYDTGIETSPFEDAREQDRQMKLFRGQEALTIGSIRELLPTVSPRTQVTILKFLLSQYTEDSSLRELILQLLTECAGTIHSPDHAGFLFGELKDASEHPRKGPLARGLERTCAGEFVRYATEKGHLWKTFVFWLLFGGPELEEERTRKTGYQEVTRKILQELPGTHADQFANEFMRENDLFVALRCLPKAPDQAKEAIARKIFSHGDMLDQPELRKKLAILLRISELYDVRLQTFIIENPQSRTEEGFQELLGKATALLKGVGRDEAKIQTFEARIREAEAAEVRRREEALKRRQSGAHAAIRKVVEEESPHPTRKPGELTDEAFALRLQTKIDDPSFPKEAIKRQAPALGSIQAQLDEHVLQVLGDEEKLREAFRDSLIREVPVEEDSFLRKFGVVAVRVKKSGSFDMELVFDEREGEVAFFYPRIHLDDVGNFTMHGFPPDLRWLEGIFRTEILRLFTGLFKKEPQRQEERETVLVLLGLKEYVPPPPEPITVESAPPEPTPPAEAPIEDPAITRTREFLDENFDTFEQAKRILEANGIPGNFRELSDAFFERQATTRINKGITPGGIRVLTQEGHLLSPFISHIDFYSVPESRETIKRLGILPSLFHVESESFDRNGELDAYIGVVHVRFPDGQEHTVHVCVLPPHFDVYVIGVDTQNALADQDKTFVAFTHFILEAFRTAVMREDDPAHHTAGLPGTPTGRPWVLRVRRVIRDITEASYPPIVVEWQPLTTRDDGDDGTDRPPRGRERGRMRREIFVNDVFEDTYTSIGSPERMLASRGTFLLGKDFVRVMPPSFMVFPPEAWTSAHGGRELRNGYNEIYIPLDSVEAIQALLEVLQNRRILQGTRTSEDAIRWYYEELLSQRRTEDIFEEGLQSQFLRTDPYFQQKCRSLFLDQSKGVPNYRALFQRILEQSRAEAPTITAEDVFRAFASMSVLNPEKAFLAVSGAADFRLPYLFRRGGEEMPDAKIFKDTDFDVAPDTALQVIEIIGGNRARISSLSDRWIRGSSRTTEMNFAARIQNQYRSQHAGREISLASRARALLVWEFVDGLHAFTYLDTARDTVQRQTLAAVPATQRILGFPRVRALAQYVERENRSRVHTDFEDFTRWSLAELERLERDGVLGLNRDPHGRIIGIGWSKPIRRKKIAILTDEQIGYRQFQLEPTTLDAYQRFGHDRGLDIGLGLSYDPRISLIQKHFYDLLEI